MDSSVWPLLFTWGVVSAISGLLITAGFSVMSMTPPAYLMAKASFTLAIFIFLAKVGFWLASAKAGILERCLLAVVNYSVGGICCVELIRWVDNRQLQTTYVKPTPSASERPWVIVKKVEFSLRSDRPIAVRLTIRNTGNAPATDVVSKWRVGLQTSPLVLNDMPPLVAMPGHSINVIAPGVEEYDENNTNRALASSRLKDLETGRAHAYVYGVIEYRNALNIAHFYKTGFCYRANQQDLNGSPDIYQEGNYAE